MRVGGTDIALTFASDTDVVAAHQASHSVLTDRKTASEQFNMHSQTAIGLLAVKMNGLVFRHNLLIGLFLQVAIEILEQLNREESVLVFI